MFKFPPISRDENVTGLAAPGLYEFKIIRAIAKMTRDKTGPNGNIIPGVPMLELGLQCWDHNKCREFFVTEYLTYNENFKYKLKHFCETVGLVEQMENGSLSPDDCIGKCGQAKIYIKVDKEGKFDDCNAVRDYMPSKEQANINKLPFNDELPF